MSLLGNIKADLDRKREKDLVDGNEKPTDSFSLKSIVDGRILINKGFRKFLPLIIILFILSLVYINNRFRYEALVKENNELKEVKLDLQTTELIKICQYKKVSSRRASDSTDCNRRLDFGSNQQFLCVLTPTSFFHSVRYALRRAFCVPSPQYPPLCRADVSLCRRYRTAFCVAIRL